MANSETIKTTIDANINTNGNQAITGAVMNSVLKQMVDSTDAQFTELSEEIGVYQGKKNTTTVIFTKDEIPSGNTILVSFVTIGGSGNVLVKDANSATLKSFAILNGEIGQNFPQESYVLPSDYHSVVVGNYGEIELSLIVTTNNPKEQGKEISYLAEQLKGASKESSIEESQFIVGYYPINRLASNTKVGDYIESVNISGSGAYRSFALSIKEGTKVISKGRNSGTIMTWCFVGADNIVKDIQNSADFVSNADIINEYVAPCDGTYYFTTSSLSNSYLKYEESEPSLKERVVSLEAEVAELSKVATQKITGGLILKKETFSSNEVISLDAFPQDAKYGDSVAFYGKIDSIDAILIGKEIGVASSYNCWLKIDNTNILFFNGTSASEPKTIIPHSLTLDTFVSLVLRIENNGICKVSINTLNGSVSKDISGWMLARHGKWEVKSENSSLRNVKVSAFNKEMINPIWIFGASYEGLSSPERWPYYAEEVGIKKEHIFWDGYAGRASAESFNELSRCLEFAKPSMLYWTMWGNGTTESLDLYIGKVYDYCLANGIELIIIDRPNATKVTDYAERSAVIKKYIDMGIRYVDAANALSSNPSDANGWYEGYLSNDGVHPTELGAKALAYQVSLDIPETRQ